MRDVPMINYKLVLGFFIALYLCLDTTQAQPSITQLENLVKTQAASRLKVDNLNRLGKLLTTKNYAKALQYAKAAEKVAFQLHYTKGLAMAYATQGKIKVNMGNDKDNSLPDYEQAARLYRKAFKFYKGLHEKGVVSRQEILEFLEGGVITVYQDLADIYYSEKKNYRRAAEFYRVLSIKFEEYAMAVRDFGLDRAIKELKSEKLKEELLRRDLEKQSLESKLLKDKLSKEELAKQVAEQNAQLVRDSIHKIQLKDSLELNRQKSAIDKAQQESALKAAQLRQQKILFFASLGGIMLVLVLAFVLFRDSRKQKLLNNELTIQRNELKTKNQDIERKNREIATNRDEIQHKNTQITESINYAQRIQEAMLPTLQRIQAALPQTFVYYKPRDIVSGDFYWFAEVQSRSGSQLDVMREGTGQTEPKEKTSLEANFPVQSTTPNAQEFIIAAMDCTGHGVPGAFMSMVGNSLLNEIVTQKRITSPALILKALNHSIRVQLQQKETQNKDGMDACICKVNLQSQTLEFAGANNPLYCISGNEIQTIKGDRFGVGGMGDDIGREYQLHTLDLHKGMTFYLCSDGYRDQLGGPKDKKFMSKNFKQLLLEMAAKSVIEQPQILDTRLKEWMDYPCKYDWVREQTDDILIIGLAV